METENMLGYNLGKRNLEEDSEEVHPRAIIWPPWGKRNSTEDSEVECCKVVHFDPEEYWLMRAYEGIKNSSRSKGYPYFFLWKGNLVNDYDETPTCTDGVKVDDSKDYCYRSCGDLLMEVFHVIIKSSSISHGGFKLSSGNIVIDFGGDLEEIYRQGDTQENYIKDEALLLPTNAPIDVISAVSIFVDLKINSNSNSEHKITNRHEKYNFDEETGDYTFKGFYWDHYTKPYLFNKPMSYTVEDEDKDFSAIIRFCSFDAATHANVEVSLIDEPSIHIYGLISARNDMITDTDYESILFLKENSSQSKLVVPGQPIELYKSMVTVPLGYNLIVRAFLRTDKYYFPSAKLIFPVQLYGESELSVRNKIQVKVTWQNYWLCPPMDCSTSSCTSAECLGLEAP